MFEATPTKQDSVTFQGFQHPDSRGVDSTDVFSPNIVEPFWLEKGHTFCLLWSEIRSYILIW